jgi:hypothetical protein
MSDVQEVLRLLRKISDLAYDEDVGEPLDCAIDYANKAIAALAATPAVGILSREKSDRVLSECGYEPATPAIGGEARTSPLTRHQRMIARDVADPHWAESINAAADILEIAAQPSSPLRGREIEDACSRPGSMVFLDGRNEHGSHVLPSLPSNISREYENSLDSYAEEIITAAEKLGFAIPGHVWTEWRWNKPDYGDAGRIEVPGYWEFVRVNADATRALSASHPEQPAACEAVANWMTLHGYATGHGDTLDDLLTELVAHVSQLAVTPVKTKETSE